MRKTLLLLITLLIPINVYAKFELKCDTNVLRENEDFICRATINSSFNYDKISFNVNSNEGIYFNEARTNHSLLWSVTSTDKEIVAESKKGLLNNNQEFAILLFSANKSGNYKIDITNIKLYNLEENETEEFEDYNLDIKIKSSSNNLKGIKINGKEINNFSPTIYDYYYNIDNDTEEVLIETTLFDDTATVKGDGTIIPTPLSKETIIPITVTSETGVNRIYRIHLMNTDEEDLDIKLSSIELFDRDNNLIEFDFNPDVYQYNIEITSDINKLTIKSIIEDKELSFLKNHETQNINVVDGDNIVLITIKNSEGKLKTYTINIVKLLFNKASNTFLESLHIEGYNLKFNKRIKTYYLPVKNFDENLKITATPEDMNSQVQIIGNNNLKEGSIIKIEVKAENQSKDVYEIILTNKETNYLKYLLILIPVTLIGIYLNRKVKTKDKKIKDAKIVIDKKKETQKKKESPKKKEAPKKKQTPKKKESSKKKETTTKAKTASVHYSHTKKKPPNKKAKKQQRKRRKKTKRK